MYVWILGLLHSGTTIFWQAWRKDRRFMCFDEPLTGDIGRWFPSNNPKRTMDEYISLLGQRPRLFWKLYEPILPTQEFDLRFTSGQEEWLQFLLDSADSVLMEETHLHMHLPAIAELTPNAHVIHLHRSARGFATSHLRPSWSRPASVLRRTVRRLRHEHEKRTFWTRKNLPPGVLRDEVIGAHPDSRFGLILSDAGYDVERIMRSPAVVRVLAYWHFHYHYIDRIGREIFGDRFCDVSYESFTADPHGVMKQLYNWMDIPVAEEVLDYREVHLPSPPFQRSNGRWHDSAEIAGFSDSEMVNLL